MDALRLAIVIALLTAGCAGTAPARPAERPPRPALILPRPGAGETLYGVIRVRSSLRPLGGARVIATEQASGRSYLAISDPLGEFFFWRVPPGSYDVLVVHRDVTDRWP